MILCLIFAKVFLQPVPANEYAALDQVVTAYGCFQASDPCKLNNLTAENACSIYLGDFGLFCDNNGLIVEWNPPGNPGGYISSDVVCVLLCRLTLKIVAGFAHTVDVFGLCRQWCLWHSTDRDGVANVTGNFVFGYQPESVRNDTAAVFSIDALGLANL
jgi:hypothetical protein